jgi:hypothetical protein
MDDGRMTKDEGRSGGCLLPFYHFTVLPLYRFATLPFCHLKHESSPLPSAQRKKINLDEAIKNDARSFLP